MGAYDLSEDEFEWLNVLTKRNWKVVGARVMPEEIQASLKEKGLIAIGKKGAKLTTEGMAYLLKRGMKEG